MAKYWLMKTEPDCFSFADLEASPGRRSGWEGVRNYQARNFMRDMKVGDGVLFYHSSTEPPHVAGIARVVREAYPDPTQYDETSQYFDPKATPAEPRWLHVDIEAERALPRPLTLTVLRDDPALSEMALLRKGQRLSVLPVSEGEWQRLLELAGVADR
jgi:predicted RNA-binding protein with PUA-like domain